MSLDTGIYDKKMTSCPSSQAFYQSPMLHYNTDWTSSIDARLQYEDDSQRFSFNGLSRHQGMPSHPVILGSLFLIQLTHTLD